MFKTTNGKMGRLHHADGTGSKGRNANFPEAFVYAPVIRAQAPPPLDINTIRQFSVGQPERSPLPERPNTSGGPKATSDLPLRGDAWKRETKDDLDCPPLAVRRKLTTFYDFPLPGPLPTRDSSLEGTPRSSKIPPVARFPTPESIDIERAMNAREMEIGMAIGSPSHAPVAWQPQDWRHIHSPSPGPTEESVHVSQIPPKHKSKWKIFGGLFGGKKQTQAAQNFYQLQAEGRPPIEADRKSPPNRGWAVPEPPVERKPETHRENKPPPRFDVDYKPQQNPDILLDGIGLEENTQQSQTGLLDVNIPSVEMERYSIMFGSVLPKQPGANQSLLARRQATLDRLMAVSEELAQKEQELQEKEKQIRHPRRATSPQPAKSPAFSLFPSTPRESRFARTTSPNGRLARSNTSPAALSPARPSFAPRLGNGTHAALTSPGPHIPVIGYESDSAPDTKAISIKQKSKKQPDLTLIVKSTHIEVTTEALEQPKQQTFMFTPDQSHLALSPEDDDIYDASPLPTTAAFPDFNRQTAPKSTGQSRQPSLTGSAISSSDSSISSNFSTTFSVAPNSSTQSPLSRSTSPHEGSTIRDHPLPMSKYTAPPQTHKTRGRSATTSASPKVHHQQPVEIPISNPQNSTTYGPRTSSAVGSQTVTNQSAVPNLLQSWKRTDKEKEKEKEKREKKGEEEARMGSLVEVSIARQISVSRKQRQLLVPINRAFQTTPSASSAQSPPLDNTPTNTHTVIITSSNAGTSRPSMRARASTVSTSSPVPHPLKSHELNQNVNFPHPSSLLKNLQSTGINVSHVTSPLTAVAKATKAELNRDHTHMHTSTSTNRSKSPATTQRGGEDRETLLAGVRPSTPMLVIVDGNRSRSGTGTDGESAATEDWAGSVSSHGRSGSGSRSGEGIAERRRKTRAEKSGLGHGYKKSENAVVERV